MRRVLILGAGTAGTMVANKLSEKLDDDWTITVVDQDETHYYQPGYLFIPFGIYSPSDVVKPKVDFLPPRVEMIMAEIDLIEPDDNRVKLADGTLELEGHEWKEHVGELRLIVARSYQRKGLGMVMARELYGLAVNEELEEIMVRMMRYGFKRKS